MWTENFLFQVSKSEVAWFGYLAQFWYPSHILVAMEFACSSEDICCDDMLCVSIRFLISRLYFLVASLRSYGPSQSLQALSCVYDCNHTHASGKSETEEIVHFHCQLYLNLACFTVTLLWIICSALNFPWFHHFLQISYC